MVGDVRMKHVMVVGATDGIGLALVREYLRRAWRVAFIGRQPEKVRRVETTLRHEFPDAVLAAAVCDVTHRDSVPRVFGELARALGQLDLVIYCAGTMGNRDDPDAQLSTFDVNTLGAVQFLDLAAQYFRDVGRGHIAAVGSIAGERGRKGNPAYCASKAALHTYLEGLRNALHAHGVRVSTIKPGFVRTRMLEQVERAPGAISPERAAVIIVRGLARRRESFFVPSRWALVALGLRVTPRAIFKRFGPA